MRLIAPNGIVYQLDRPSMVVGRNPGVEIFLDDLRVAGEHARVDQDGSNFRLTDLGSPNGTFVNNLRIIGAQPLQPGDAISFGGAIVNVADDYGGYSVPPSAGAAGYGGYGQAPMPPSSQPQPDLYGRPKPFPSAGPAPYQPAVPQFGAPGYGAPAAGAPYAAPAVTKDRTSVVIIEVVGGLFGFLGIGWIYAGQTTTGIILLFGNWLFQAVQWTAAAFTLGLSLCLTGPLWLAALIISAVMLNGHARQHPELFRS